MLLIKNATYFNADGSGIADILIKNSKIAQIERDIIATEADVIDASGLYTLPGLVDPHVHMTSSGLADTFEEATILAALGGVTTFIDFLYLRKANSYQESLENYLKDQCKYSAIDYSFHLTLTDLNSDIADQLSIMREAGLRSVKIYTTFRDTEKFPDEKYEDLIINLKKEGFILTVHAEDDKIIQKLENSYTDEGKTDLKYLHEVRPPEAEAKKILEIGQLCKKHVLPMYIVHLTSKQGIEAVEKLRSDGVDVYVETLPHYLVLTNDYRSHDETIRNLVVPPLREQEDVDALIEAVLSEKIQTIATDHFGKSLEQKMQSKSITDWVCGFSISEIYLPVLYQVLVIDNDMPVERLVSLLSEKPARIFDLYPRKGRIAVGADADLVLIDPQKELKITYDDLKTKVGYSPFESYKAKGLPVMTILGGKIIARDGEYLGLPGIGHFVSTKY